MSIEKTSFKEISYARLVCVKMCQKISPLNDCQVRNWNHVCQNVPVDTATYWATQVLDFCNGRLKDSGAIFIKQDNIKQEIVLTDMKDVKVEVGEEFGIKVEITEELVVKEEVEDPDYNSLNNLRSIDSLCLDFVKKEPEAKVQIKKEPRSKKTTTEMRKTAIEKKPLIVEEHAPKKEDKLTKNEEIKKEVKTTTIEEVKKEDEVIKKEESNLNVQPVIKKYHRGSKSQGNLKKPPAQKNEAASKKSEEFEGIFHQAKKGSQAKKRPSLWEASGDLEMPKRGGGSDKQETLDAILAAKLQLEERRRSGRTLNKLASQPLLLEKESMVMGKKMGLSEACILLPMSRLNPEQLEQLKVWPLSQACQMKPGNDAGSKMPLMPMPSQLIKQEIKKEEVDIPLLPPAASQLIKKEIKKETAAALMPVAEKPLPSVETPAVASQLTKKEIKKEASVPRRSKRGVKKERWVVQSDLQGLSDLTEIGTEVEVKTEAKVEKDDSEEKKKEVKVEKEGEVKEGGEYWEEDSENRMNETEKRKSSTEKVERYNFQI